MVVVAGDDHDPPAGGCAAEGSNSGRTDLERLGERALAQLQRVAQQHDAIGAGERLEQPLARRHAAMSAPPSAPRCRSDMTAVAIRLMVAARQPVYASSP